MKPVVLIVDDEQLARASLSRKIAELPETYEIISEANPFVALEILCEKRVDVLFLDIQMPGLSGFELLAHIPVDRRDFHLIFCTAHAEHAVQAFHEAATDYLLKPVEPERLSQSLARARGDGWKSAIPKVMRLMASVGSKKVIHDVGEFSHFVSDTHETVGYLRSGKEVIVNMTLGQLEEQLPESFVRSHRSAIVNLVDVGMVLSAGEQLLRLKSDVVVPLARRRRKKILDLLESRR